MADIKINILGDSQNLKSATESSIESLSKLSKTVAKNQVALNATGKETDSYVEGSGELLGKIKLLTSANEKYQSELKATEENLKLVNKVSKSLYESGAGNAKIIEDLAKANEAYTSKKADILKARDGKNSRDDLENELAFFRLTGDAYGEAQKQLSIYGDKLRETIALRGRDSEAAKKAADVYSKQKQVVKELSDEQGRASGRIQNLLKSFISAQAVVWAVQASFRAFVTVFKDSALASSKAEETANLFGTTFETVISKANKEVQYFVGTLGLAKSTAQQTLGVFGDMAMGYGQAQEAALEFARQATQFTLDTASFKNLTGDIETISKTVASGLAGNFQNFRTMGIIVTQAEIKNRLYQKGLDKLTGSSYQFAKIQETLNIVLEKTKNAHGDMEKTMDSTENINRRLAEANRSLLEIMGKGVNETLNPLKQMWIEIATEITKATEAQKLFNAGQKNIKTYDIVNNEEDRKTFDKAIEQELRAYRALNAGDAKRIFETGKTTEKLIEIMTKFDATAEDMNEKIKSYLGESFSMPNLPKLLTAQMQAAGEKLKVEQAQEIETDESVAKYSQSLEKLFSVINSISEINGVKVSSTKHNLLADETTKEYYSGSLDRATLGVSVVEGEIGNVIQQAINSLTAALPDTFGDAIDKTFSETFATDNLKAKAESIKKLYEYVYNYYLTTGDKIIDSGEQNNLNKLIDGFKGVNNQLDDIKKSEAFIKLFESGQKNLVEIGLPEMSELEKNLAAVEKMRQEMLESATTPEQIASVNLLANKYTDRYRGVASTEEANIFSKYQSGMGKIYAPEEKALFKNPQIQSIYSQMLESANTQIAAIAEELVKNGTYTKEQATQFETTEKAKAQTKSEEIARGKQIEQEQEQLSSKFVNMFGELGTFATTIDNAATGMGALSSILMDIAGQTEIIKRISSIISDTIVPVLDAFFRPLVPIIDLLIELVQSQLMNALGILYPILKQVGLALAFAIGAMQTFSNIVVDSLKWLIGNISKFFLDAWNAVINALRGINIFGWKPFGGLKGANTSWADSWASTDVFGNAKNNWNKTLETLDKINNTAFEIKKNTDKSVDLSYLDTLKSKGLINAQEYDALAAQKQGLLAYDIYNASSYDNSHYAQYREHGNGVSVSYGNVTIMINGSDKDAKEIANAVKRELENMNRPGRNAYVS